jgi:CYTH domain-containing protein
MIEIERKYLVTSRAYRDRAESMKKMVQGFLNTDPERTVRVRIFNNEGYLTIKGKSNATGTTRFEWERKIPKEEAVVLLEMCEKPLIEKNRFEVRVGGHIFEVDEFLGANEGLVLAEVELQNENEKIAIPDWLGEEVTGHTEYYNSQLIKNPYSRWTQ